MTWLRRLLLTHLFGESVIQWVLTSVGVFTFLAGVLYLPFLGPSRVEMILALLLLAAVALLCHVVGQLALIADRLDAQAAKNAAPGAQTDGDCNAGP